MVRIYITPTVYTTVNAEDSDLCEYNWFMANGYACRKRNGLNWAMHRDIAKRMGFTKGADHINRDRLDNRRCNLREATSRQNNMNNGIRRDNRSGYKGVDNYRGRWRSTISAKGGIIHLGLFDTAKEAAIAYDKCAVHAHGEFAYLNFPELHGQTQ